MKLRLPSQNQVYKKKNHMSQSQLLKCWLKPKRKGVASALTVNQAEASLVLDIVKAIAVGDVFIEEHE